MALLYRSARTLTVLRSCRPLLCSLAGAVNTRHHSSSIHTTPKSATGTRDGTSVLGKHFIPFPKPHVATSVTLKDHALKLEEHMLEVTWADGNKDCYPFIYLRDNCQCPACFHEGCKQRLVKTLSLDLSIKPVESHISENHEEINITWPDGHSSVFKADWLYERRFPESLDKINLEKKRVVNDNIITWDSSLNGQIPAVDFNEVMEDDLTLFHWMDIMTRTGLSLLTNAPALPGQLKRLANRVGHLKSTNYGDIFEVLTKVSTTNLAYTSEYLQLHIDLPFYEYQPGVQLLHCIDQCEGEGGVSHLVDGLTIAQQLRDYDLEGYKFMCTTPLTFVDVGSDDYGDYYMRHTRPMIGIDGKGNAQNISFNQTVRDSILKLPVDKVMPMYKTYLKMVQLMYDPRNLVEKKLEPGDILCMNNRRVLHGRTAFTPEKDGRRWLQGVYFDWDCVYSKMRVIADKHNIKTHIWS